MRRRDLILGGFAYSLIAACRGEVLNQDPHRFVAGAPLSAEQIKNIVRALRVLGDAPSTADTERLLSLADSINDESAAEIAAILDRHTLMRVGLDAHGIGIASRGGSGLELRELGWRSFLVRVDNPARLTGPLILVNRYAIPEGDLEPGIHEPHILGSDVASISELPPDLEADRDRDITAWLGFRFGAEGMVENRLAGLPIEYQIIQLYSQLPGARRALLAVGSSTLRWLSPRMFDSRGFGVEFQSQAAKTVSLKIRDVDGQGTTASLTIRDASGRLYPAPAHRLEPDLTYQQEIYRADGESIRLPAGRYQLFYGRGPEYLKSSMDFTVAGEDVLTIQLERWIDTAHVGWYAGDPHLHPEGQTYGIVSKYGVTPETMLRQVRGEGLWLGSVLIWTGGYYYEKQFFSGHVYQPAYQLPFSAAREANNSNFPLHPTVHDADSMIRYDVEQAAFPSNRLGHPIFLGLRHHEWPGGSSVYDWPSWNLPILRWARAQGAVVGYSHVGADLVVQAGELPNYEIPALDGIGGNECLVDVTHGAIDFLCGGESRPVQDLNLWYHLLNCGFQLPMLGETDFWTRRPHAGTVRTYVKLDEKPVGDPGYAAWLTAAKAGKVYFGDGRSHLMDFQVTGREVNAPVALRGPAHVTLTAKVAARLAPDPFDIDREWPWSWHIERARLGTSDRVLLEAIVNGQPVAQREIIADGKLREMSFKVEAQRSCWVALRILPSSHTAPLWISVSDLPVRASKRSAQWCLNCVEVLWKQHAHRIRNSELEAAAAAWDHARDTYRRIMSECNHA